MVTVFAIILSTLAGASVGILIVIIFMPWIIIVMVLDPLGFAKFPLLFAAPTTAIVLPFISVSLKDNTERTICLLIFGTVSGALTQFLFMTHGMASSFPRTDMAQIFLLSGGLAGLAAAAAFDGIVREGMRAARRR
jgi:hypothetical protein